MKRRVAKLLELYQVRLITYDIILMQLGIRKGIDFSHYPLPITNYRPSQI
ncbi:hypothetical protein [Fischerella thermalis]